MKPLRYKYQTIEFGDNDIHLRTLKDKQQFSDKDKKAEDLGISSATWSLFGVVWPSSEVLANFIFDYDFKNKRILEVGCGIGLSSLILNRLNADITATDYHPEAEKFLDINTELNKDDEIPFIRTCWSNEYQEELGKFDLIIGSDLLYERDHAVLLSNFIKQMETFGFSFSFIEPKNTDFLEEPYKGKIFKYSRE